MPRLLLLAAVIIWGWTFVATRILVAELGPVEIFAARLAIGLPFLVIIMLLRRIPLRFTRDDTVPLLVGGGIFTLHFLVQITGLETTTATNSAWIIAVSPLALAVLSWLLLKERIGPAAIAGITVATLGILLLVSRGRFGDLGWLKSTGDWLVLLSAFTWSAYTVATRNLSRRRDPLAVTVGIVMIASVCTFAVFAFTGNLASLRALSPRGWVSLLYLAIPGLALGQWFWQVGVAELGAARAGLFLYLEPLATMTLAIPLLKEPFGVAAAIGAALVLAGVYVGQKEGKAS